MASRSKAQDCGGLGRNSIPLKTWRNLSTPPKYLRIKHLRHQFPCDSPPANGRRLTRQFPASVFPSQNGPERSCYQRRLMAICRRKWWRWRDSNPRRTPLTAASVHAHPHRFASGPLGCLVRMNQAGRAFYLSRRFRSRLWVAPVSLLISRQLDHCSKRGDSESS